MDSLKVKICDVRSPEIANFCSKNFVDFIGLHKIYLPIKKEDVELFKTIKKASGRMQVVLVTKIQDIEELTRIICEVPFDYVQLHFETTTNFVRKLKESVYNYAKREVGVISVFQADKCDFASVQQMGEVADFLLFDTSMRGGTGTLSSEEAFSLIASNCSDLRYFIAGGLNADNVKEVILKSHPYALDVQSGVEKEKHVKDKEKIKAFVHAVRNCSE